MKVDNRVAYVPKTNVPKMDKRINWAPMSGQRAVIDMLCEQSGQHASVIFRALIRHGFRTAAQIEKLGGLKAIRVLLAGKPESSEGGISVRFSTETAAEIMGWLSRVDYGASLSVGTRWLIYYALQLLSVQPESIGVEMVKEHAKIERRIGIRIGRRENEFQVALRLAAEAASQE